MEHTIETASIVAAVDASEPAGRAVRWAAEQADRQHRHLVVVAYGEDDPRARALLDDAVAEATDGRPALSVTPMHAGTDPRRLLVALSHQASLITLGSRGGGGLRSMFLGSVASVVGTHAACPVMLCRAAPPAAAGRRVLVGVEGGPECRPVLELAFDQAALRGRSLTVAPHLWDLVGAATGFGSSGATDADAGTRDKHRLLLDDLVGQLAEAYPEVRVSVQDAARLARDVAAGRAADWELLVAPRHAVGAPDELASWATVTDTLEHGPTSVAVVPVTPPAFAP